MPYAKVRNFLTWSDFTILSSAKFRTLRNEKSSFNYAQLANYHFAKANIVILFKYPTCWIIKNKLMNKTLEFETTQFDFELVNHVKFLRKEQGISKENLSIKMGLSKTFVGNVESFTQRHKYSTRHLTLLAKAFGFKNISDLLQFPTPKYDKIKITVKQTFNESGSKVISNEVLRIEEL